MKTSQVNNSSDYDKVKPKVVIRKGGVKEKRPANKVYKVMSVKNLFGKT